MKLKKSKNSFTVFLMLVLFFTQIGIFKYSHFCGNELAGQSFFIADNDCGCDPKEENGCCENHMKVIQFKKEGLNNGAETNVKANSFDLFFFPTLKSHEEFNWNATNFQFKKNYFVKVKIPPAEILLQKRCLLI